MYFLPSRLGGDRRGLLPLAAFPLLFPLPRPHPPSLTLAQRGSRSPVAALTTAVPPPLSFGGYSLRYYLPSLIQS